LRHFFGGAEPIKPRHQRGVQACGDCESRGWNRGGGSPRFALTLRLKHRPRHFLNEQRDAISTRDYFLPSVLRQRRIAGNTVD
jgi:hypothetical protein